jgi:predicted Zn-ribbon and HTH transcriptional regulator
MNDPEKIEQELINVIKKKIYNILKDELYGHKDFHVRVCQLVDILGKENIPHPEIVAMKIRNKCIGQNKNNNESPFYWNKNNLPSASLAAQIYNDSVDFFSKYGEIKSKDDIFTEVLDKLLSEKEKFIPIDDKLKLKFINNEPKPYLIKPKNCAQCGNEFQPKSRNQIICPNCRNDSKVIDIPIVKSENNNHTIILNPDQKKLLLHDIDLKLKNLLKQEKEAEKNLREVQEEIHNWREIYIGIS